MLTPREYLSWSSMDLLERDEKKWIQIYLYGEKNRINRGMALGRQMAEGLENGEMTGDMTLDLVIERLPKFEIMDKPVEADLKIGKKVIHLLAKPDTMKKNMTAFKEYKTGQDPWTQAKVDKSGQLEFYNTVFYLKTGKIERDIELVYVPTEKQVKGALDAKLGVCGDIQSFKRVVTMTQVLKMCVRMKKAWARIEEICEEELL